MGSMNKTALVTGGTDGIGKEIAIGLAQAGCQVLIVGLDAEKGVRVESDVRERTWNPHVHFLRADLGLVRDTRRLASDVAHRCATLSYLVHSAGVVRGRRELTAEGIESNFAINYLSRFVLTVDLLPLLARSSTLASRSRILMISGAARGGRIHFDDVNLTRHFGTLRAVMQFCQANDLFTVELASRLTQGSAPDVTINCLKVGVVKTNIRRGFPVWMKWFVPLVLDPILSLSTHDVAAAALRLLADSACQQDSGALFQFITRFKRISVPKRVQDARARSRLWMLSEQLAAAAVTGA